jgi:AcrR family transcriptional regulator
MFRKPGRPPEDRLRRRREIWAAVSSLIEKHGASNLTMRRAAAAAFISLGGLYNYFPNKRSLVLYGLDQEALGRLCEEFTARRYSDPAEAAEAFIHFFADQESFVRPAVLAALELGAEEFMSRLEANMNMGLDGFVETLRHALPDTDDSDLLTVARSARRLMFAGLLDRSMTQRDLEEELRAVLRGIRIGRASDLVAS